MSEKTQEVKNSLRTCELLTKALAMPVNTKEYNEIKKYMTKEEKAALKHTQQARSLERHNINKQNGCAKKVPRTKKQKTEPQQSLNNDQTFAERTSDEGSNKDPIDEKPTTEQQTQDNSFDLNHIIVADLQNIKEENTQTVEPTDVTTPEQN